MCVCVCVCVWLDSSRSFTRVSLNNKNKLYLYNLFKFLSSFLISVLILQKQVPPMMAYEGSGSARDDFEKFIYQFQPET